MTPFILCALAALTAAAPADTVTTTTDVAHGRWEASLGYARQWVRAGQPAWQTYTAGVGRRWARGALFVRASRTQRFSLRDEAVLVDSYLPLWKNAYGNLRLQAVSDPQVRPRSDAGAEIVQGVGGVWEVSGGYRHQKFPTADVHLVALGLAHYVGNWYLRERTTLVSVAGEHASSHAVAARRYLDGVDNHVELTAGGGREVVELAPADGSAGIDVDLRRTYFAAARAQTFVRPSLGLSLNVNVTDHDRIPTRWGAEFGILTRW